MAEGATNVAAPSLSLFGAGQLSSDITLQQALTELRALAWRPSYITGISNEWPLRYAAEAVLAQGWGTEFDIAILAEQLFSRAGVSTDRMDVVLTDVGREALRNYLGYIPGDTSEDSNPEQLLFDDMNTLPSLFYRDASGEGQVMVFPFMRTLRELEGYAFLAKIQDNIQTAYPEVMLTVTVEAMPISDEAKDDGSSGSLNVGGLFGSLGSSVAGGETIRGSENKKITVLDERFKVVDMSTNAIDIGFALADDKAWVAYIDTPLGRKAGKPAIETKDYQPVKVTYEIQYASRRFSWGASYTHEVILAENQELDGLFVTLGLNLPDVQGDSLMALDKVMRGFPADANPDDISALRWYTRNILYRFTGQQTMAEAKLAQELELAIGRTSTARCIAVTVQQQKNGSLTTGINLLSPFNQVHNGTEDAISAFNILSGFSISKLEGVALGSNGIVYSDIWDAAPEEAVMFAITPDSVRENIPILREFGYPEALVARMEANYNIHRNFMYIMNDMPTLIDGRERWAMLQIDCNSFQTIAVMDDGSNGGFAEFLITYAKASDPGDYLGYTCGVMVGAITGVGAMCAAALITSDYEETIALAQAYAGKVLEDVKTFFSLHGATTDAIKLSGGEGNSGDLLGPFKAEGKLGDTPGDSELKFGLDLGPVAGFEKGLNYYFSKIN